MDGTFKKVPAAFLQLYTIHGLIAGKFKPFLFALMTRKTRILYERLLDMMREILPTLQVQTASIDFEMGMISAIRAKYPGNLL